MREQLNKAKLKQFFSELGKKAKTAGNCYITGGATAVWHGWRETTIDIDLKFDPEPVGVFEAIPTLKNQLQVNVELASPDQFIPEVPGWRERSEPIGDYGNISLFHYDYVAQALSKIERGHAQDVKDVEQMVKTGLVNTAEIRQGLIQIEKNLCRYPAIDAENFLKEVEAFLKRLEAGGV